MFTQMAEALARGFCSKGVAKADRMCCYDPSELRRKALKGFGVTPCSSSIEVIHLDAVCTSTRASVACPDCGSCCMPSAEALIIAKCV